jgi:stage II sporulation protein GA (sporulation sigma-E factor processing peptidase)
MTIYVDIVFLINFIMNVFILWAVKIVSKKTTPFYRVIMGGFLMALLYLILIFFTIFDPWVNVILTNIILFVGVLTSFKIHNLKEFCKIITLSYACAFGIGGVAIGLFFNSNINNILGSGINFSINNFSFKILFFSTSVFYILLKLFLNWQVMVGLKKQIFYDTKIFYEEEVISFRGLVDTGNSLTDPVSRMPVIIVEFDIIKDILPNEVKLAFYEKNEKNLLFIQKIPIENIFLKRLKIVPFTSLGQNNGMLICFKPDKIEIQKDKESKIVNDVIVGIHNNKLSKNEEYRGLLNPKIIN